MGAKSGAVGHLTIGKGSQIAATYDREQIRKFYLDEGYADFQVVSAVAELTKDGNNFVITFVLDEGQVYEFGEYSIISVFFILLPLAILMGQLDNPIKIILG